MKLSHHPLVTRLSRERPRDALIDHQPPSHRRLSYQRFGGGTLSITGLSFSGSSTGCEEQPARPEPTSNIPRSIVLKNADISSSFDSQWMSENEQDDDHRLGIASP